MDISGKALARNSLLNLISQLLPVPVAMCTIPLIIRGLGQDRFGLLSLAWIVLGYFTVFDLGLGRATTKHVAEALGRGDQEGVSRIVSTVATAQIVLGVVGSVIMAALTPLLVARVLKVSVDLRADATAVLYLLAGALPLILLSASLSGVLEAAQRFDLVNAVKVPSSVLVCLIPLVGYFTAASLTAIVCLILLSRVAALGGLWILIRSTLPGLECRAPSGTTLKHLLSFGGWVTISSVVAPILLYLDRFMVASICSLSAVAFYTAPYDALMRLLIIPGSLTATLYPSFSNLLGAGHQERAQRIFARSVKYLSLGMGPIVLAAVLFAHDILRLWLGEGFARRSGLTMQILAVGVLANSLAFVPVAFLQGAGHPEIPAKFHLVELVVYVPLLWFLIHRWGIVGAATAWGTRTLFDCLLLFAAAWRVGGIDWRVLKGVGTPAVCAALSGLVSLAYLAQTIPGGSSLLFRVLSFAGMLGALCWIAWTRLLDDRDRSVIAKALNVAP